jgi:succinate-acetate transporter protein
MTPDQRHTHRDKAVAVLAVLPTMLVGIFAFNHLIGLIPRPYALMIAYVTMTVTFRLLVCESEMTLRNFGRGALRVVVEACVIGLLVTLLEPILDNYKLLQ